MKQIDKLILRSFIGPLLLTFVLAVFVLLMQFLWKYIDDMVGKGLDFWIIAQLLFYASATFVPMALPVATLFASIMTMGNFGEKYELIAMKAGGISLRRVMLPMTLVVLVFAGLAFYFSNNVLPVAWLKYKTTLYDVTRKKPALNIKPSEYYSGIDGYVIRIDGKDKENKDLRNITVYDHSDGMGNNNVTVAQRGKMSVTPDERYLIFDLYNGYSYSEDTKGDNYFSRPMTRVKFDEQTMRFDLSTFAFSKTDNDFFKGNYQMMNVTQLRETMDTLMVNREGKIKEFRKSVLSRLYTRNLTGQKDSNETFDDYDYRVGLSELEAYKQKRVQNSALQSARTVNEDIAMYEQILKNDQEYINRHSIEWHRKFTLSVACLVLFLVGAPFGSIVRKGGLGLPMVASVVFFVLYYVMGMIAEKAIREGALQATGMWVSTLVLLPIGILLTLKATSDSPIFDSGSWKKNIRKIIRVFIRTKK